ncbi:MAG TPA: carboxyl transferase domain-containing protein [Stellaceae bacterium]|nr:carboxyl transferase domain-containing protein [Stellaceae bacterium]
MSWQPELDELRQRERMARELGGPDKVKRQHDAGKLTVRERIDALVDKTSFHEVGAIAGKADYDAGDNLKELVPANCVFGRARIDGRPVVVVGDDFTVRGGSADATIREKPLMAEQMAHDLRLPIIRIIEGSGGGGSVKTIETTGRANLPGRVNSALPYYYTTTNLGRVPVVALGLGSVAGLGSARLCSSHYSVMTKETSAMFVAGPPVVNALGGKPLDRFELGGWEIQTRCGAIDHAVDTEEEAFEATRRFLSYLPSSVFELPPKSDPTDNPERRDEFLFDVIPRDTRKVYKMRPIVETVIDQGSFFELGRMFGRGMITGLARIDGVPVAVMASDPFFYGGAWTADVCDKIIRFVDLAETFHLPVIYLCDCPGFHIGLDAEKSATIRKGVRAMAAVNQSTVPWCTFLVRNVFGVAGAINQPSGRFSIRYAWLSARWGSLPLEGGIEAAYRAEIDAADDPQAKIAEIDERLQKLRSPFRTAGPFWIEEIIDPRDTRKLLVEFAGYAEKLRQPGESKFCMRP